MTFQSQGSCNQYKDLIDLICYQLHGMQGLDSHITRSFIFCPPPHSPILPVPFSAFCVWDDVFLSGRGRLWTWGPFMFWELRLRKQAPKLPSHILDPATSVLRRKEKKSVEYYRHWHNPFFLVEYKTKDFQSVCFKKPLFFCSVLLCFWEEN